MTLSYRIIGHDEQAFHEGVRYLYRERVKEVRAKMGSVSTSTPTLRFPTNYAYVVAYDAGRPIGYIRYVERIIGRKRVLATSHTFVLPDYRGHRVAGKMVYRLIALAKRNGIRHIIRANQSNEMIQSSLQMKDHPRHGKKGLPAERIHVNPKEKRVTIHLPRRLPSQK